MKKQTKGIIFTVLFGGGLLFCATAASMPGVGMMGENEEQITITGTPEDNFPDVQRAQFCETGEAKSNQFVQEYKIPTKCTQPLAIVTDPQGNVWFAQTNTGKIAKFDPNSESFIEYENPSWPEQRRSMMWGMDYSPDGSIWYTDEAHDRIWKFSIQDEEYVSMTYPSDGESLPQRLKIHGSEIIVNDFTGGKLTFLDPAQVGEEVTYTSLPSPIESSLAGDFAIDSQNNVWYTNWIFQTGGILVKFDRDAYTEDSPLNTATSVYEFPTDLTTPNGVVIGPEGKLWIVDTSSSFFFSFDPESLEFTKYITSAPHSTTYGNSSGLIKSPVSRPYWTEVDTSGQIVFNEQTANRMGFFDPIAQTLVEYLIPSKNPNWADCEGLSDCGLAQMFGFTIDGSKVWFTQWVENNIGVVDTSVTLPYSIETTTQEITIAKGETVEFHMTVTPQTTSDISNISFVTSDTSAFFDLVVEPDTSEFQLDSDTIQVVKVSLTARESALATSHKLLVGAQTDDVTISQYITVNIIR